MTQVQCKKCGVDVSVLAKSCSACGQSDPGVTNKRKVIGGLVVAFAVAIGAGIAFAPDRAEPTATTVGAAETAVANDEACRADLHCWSERQLVFAVGPCRRAVEKMAQHSAKWTDTVSQSKFSRSAWRDEAEGVIVYMGDRVQFQNGFGAYQNHAYTCVWDSKKQEVIEVAGKQGAL